jgi:hypothetical protein
MSYEKSPGDFIIVLLTAILIDTSTKVYASSKIIKGTVERIKVHGRALNLRVNTKAFNF